MAWLLSILIAGIVGVASTFRDEPVLAAQVGPSPDLGAGAVFDEARRTLVVVGSLSAAAGSLETWLFSRGRWTRVSGSSPPARSEPYLVYDRARQRVILHGGSRTAPSDTWEWDGTAWHQLATDGPPSRSGAAMSYDAGRRRVVLFGGRTSIEPGTAELDDTWEWDGDRWIRMPTEGPGQAPPGRILHAMAYDDARGRTVLFGGVSLATTKDPNTLGDTWQWDGTTWTRIDGAGGAGGAGPGARDHVAMAYDPRRRALVLYGGNTPGEGARRDTWLFDGSRWTLLNDDGPPRYRHRLVFDSDSDAVVFYGGNGLDGRTNELWRLIGARWSRVAGIQSTEEQRVLATEDEYVAAEVKRDEAALRRLVDDRFVYNRSDGTTSGKEELIQGVLKMRMTGQTIRERSVRLEGDIALVFATSELRTTNAAGEASVTMLRYTATYVRRDGTWRMLALQMQPRAVK